MVIDAQDVKLLREKTGSGIMDCKKALMESGGDFQKAIKYLKEKGLAEAGKRSARETKEGLITLAYSGERDKVLMVSINCETDFVSRNEKYREFVQVMTELLLKKEVETVDNLPEEVNNKIKEAISFFGENIIIRKLAYFEKTDRIHSELQSYIHLGGRVGVIAEFFLERDDTKENEDFQEFSKNVLLQIASMGPVSITKEDFPKDLLEEQKDIFMKQAKESRKPQNIIENIVKGKIEKLLKEYCLLEQKYVKDNSINVSSYLKNVENTIESKIEIRRFARFKLGEE